MRALRVCGTGSGEAHEGEVFCCTYAADGAFVLSGGWDGYLRLWSADGQLVSALQASSKPLSCCTLTPDGSAWIAASMDGVLSWWDPMSHHLKLNFVAHIRPISGLRFSPDGRLLATASWDRRLMIRGIGQEREGVSLNGHRDIVSGCQWFPDSKQLLSWSHDGTLRLWDAATGREIGRLHGHEDRVTAACLSGDGRWAVSGGRDGMIKVWDVAHRIEIRSVQLGAEVCGCWCLLDNRSVVALAADGRLGLWSLPGLEMQAELSSECRALCGDLSPSGKEIVLGGEDGQLCFIAIDGVLDPPLLVTPTQRNKPKSGVLSRILGKQPRQLSYQYTCPACHHTTEVASLPSESIPCPTCKRLLRVSTEVLQLQPQ